MRKFVARASDAEAKIAVLYSVLQNGGLPVRAHALIASDVWLLSLCAALFFARPEAESRHRKTARYSEGNITRPYPVKHWRVSKRTCTFGLVSTIVALAAPKRCFLALREEYSSARRRRRTCSARVRDSARRVRMVSSQQGVPS